MRRMRTSDSEPVPGLAELSFHILLALGDGPSHGYAIGKRTGQALYNRPNSPSASGSRRSRAGGWIRRPARSTRPFDG